MSTQSALPGQKTKLAPQNSRFLRTLLRSPNTHTPQAQASPQQHCALGSILYSIPQVTLHLSQLWVPLFRPRTWAPTLCSSWVPLTTERRHGLSVRPLQNEQTAASVRTDACLLSRPDLHSSTPLRFCRVFLVTHPVSPSQPGWTGIKLLPNYTLLHPCAFTEFFRVTRPISPCQPGLTGINLLVTLHLSQLWVPLFRPRTWAPFLCGSWVPLTTERHHGLSVRPNQTSRRQHPSEQLIQREVYYWLTSDACFLPPNTHGLTVAIFPVGPVHLMVVRGLRRLVFFGNPAHWYHVAVVHHRRSRDKLFRGWHD